MDCLLKTVNDPCDLGEGGGEVVFSLRGDSSVPDGSDDVLLARRPVLVFDDDGYSLTGTLAFRVYPTMQVYHFSPPLKLSCEGDSAPTSLGTIPFKRHF